jgi:tRNA threonylcarbamoyladenosine biosynthesis protein TsaB
LKWLAMDTSTSVLAVAVTDEETVLGDTVLHLKRHHAERLLPTIDRMLSDTNVSLRDIGGIAVTRGPGSYTGVRIGVTTAKMLAWSLKLPLVGISSLAALAVNGRRFSGSLIPMWDARRERVYTGHYRFDKNENIPAVHQDRVVPVKDWVKRLTETEGPFLFLGDGAVQYRDIIVNVLKERAFFATVEENVVRPSSVGRLAMEQWSRGGSDDVARFVPEYLQVTEAEAKWEIQK